MTPGNRSIGLLAAPTIAALLILASGCRHQDEPVAQAAGNGDSRPKGVTKEEQIKAVLADPHIPEQAKAIIVRHLQGKPPTQPGAQPSK